MAGKKSNAELESELALKSALEAERAANKELFSIKLIEKIVFGVIAAGAIAVIGGIVDLVFKHIR